METTVIHGISYKGRILELASEDAGDYPAEIVRSWVFEHTSYTGAVALDVGKRLTEERIGAAAFGSDADTVAVAKGLFAAQKTIKAWNWKSEDGTDIPVTPETIGTLPPTVLKQFWLKVVRGEYPTDEELEALKLPLAKRSQASTGAAA